MLNEYDSTPLTTWFAQPVKGRSGGGTGLTRVRGGRAAPSHSRFNLTHTFFSLSILLIFSATFFLINIRVTIYLNSSFPSLSACVKCGASTSVFP